ncbi:hypothetical protein M404DRAFT_998529 [Pisolithus tinctorius Marx 270]|uniref:Uncharacterized protein n=1 Tax=Pisolithus tinctorius Marx 270 TaxID=870435 RepID=A0A0C3JDF2_PISTI|nr:hypothetical protein M404DRAFT_998529 [Pisolithus tinctorius Marx 270]
MRDPTATTKLEGNDGIPFKVGGNPATPSSHHPSRRSLHFRPLSYSPSSYKRTTMVGVNKVHKAATRDVADFAFKPPCPR